MNGLQEKSKTRAPHASIAHAASSDLLVFADDWGRHPSSAQHLIRNLLPAHQVTWVNTIGTRPPRFDWKTISRGLEKIKEWRSPPSNPNPASGPAPHILAPRMWPWFRRPWDRRLNRHLLTRALNAHLVRRNRPTTAITTLPIVADLIGTLQVDRWVYYCVDDFAAWPGLDAEPLRRMERDLIARADRVIAVSASLRDRMSQLRGEEIPLLTHGVDLGHWQSESAASDLLSGCDSPRILFWGLIDRRLDLALLQRLNEGLGQGSIILVGPEDNPDPTLATLSHVNRLPAVSFNELPALAREADVLIMPYADLPVTRMMQPLKLLEYLASPKPVVARNLPAVEPWADCLDAVSDPTIFAQRVLERLRTGLPASQGTARARLATESWAAKARQFESLVLS